jgi:hypothetical protein
VWRRHAITDVPRVRVKSRAMVNSNKGILSYPASKGLPPSRVVDGTG